MKSIGLEILKEAIRRSWSKETSNLPVEWTPKKSYLGQCAATALVVQDYKDGELLFALIGYDDFIYGTHIWNRLLNGREIDFTREQYPNIPDYCFHGTVIKREEVLCNVETKERYVILKQQVEKLFE